jgi:hypothetical protein
LSIKRIPYSPVKDVKFSDKVLAIVAGVIFVLTFIISPFQIEF